MNIGRVKCQVFFVLFMLVFIGYAQQASISGTLKKWHKVTLSFQGDDLKETDAENPFLNYRLNVVFKHKNKVYVVPGFYAADGNAAQTSANKGGVWQVRFMPDEVGEWRYEALFRKGDNVAVSSDIHAGVPTAFNGAKGSFVIKPADTTGSNLRVKGRLQYVNSRYLEHADTKTAFIKGGADSPENFLAYYEFDNTKASHKYAPHATDWKTGDPVWQNNKGKNIIGALNYLASKKMNSVYFLTMNLQGDGDDVFPWISTNERYRFDCSKLDQWEMVFDHMDHLGIMLHIVTQETENELLLDIGALKTQRKLYYRELIARFSHHLGVTWNLGEENGPQSWSPKGQTDADRQDMAGYIKKTDPYNNYIVLHTHAKTHAQDLFLTPLLGDKNVNGVAMQTKHINNVHKITKRWINTSANFNNPWLVTQDEIGPAHAGAKPDKDDNTHNEIRHKVLWGNLMAGGAGVEWYFGYKFDNNDLTCEDWRSRDNLWNQTAHALAFFDKYIPFKTMQSKDDLTDNPKDYVLAQDNVIYAVYLPEYKKTKLNLTKCSGKFSVAWFNPRNGGVLQTGNVKTLVGSKKSSIGKPPTTQGDWVAVIKSVDSKSGLAPNKVSNKTIVLQALKDFKVDTTSAATYYKEKKRGSLAIRANKEDQRNKLAIAKTTFKGKTGYYHAVLNTLAENDGESVYKLYTNKSELKTVVNPKVAHGFKEVQLSLGVVFIKKNVSLKIASMAVTNGNIPENEGTAWSRGRWTNLRLTPVNLNFKQQLSTVTPFKEQDGKVQIEAEFYHHNTNNKSPRKFYQVTQTKKAPFTKAKDYSNTASGNGYIVALPDTRVTDKDKLIRGENFFQVPGTGGIVSYKVKISTPGRYYVWVKALSTGAEDNGLHVGLNGAWPKSGQRIQLCKGKRKWTWSSAQRVPKNHCGVPNTIYLDINEAGEHIVSFSMREDGFKLDQFMLVRDKSFTPL